VASTLIEVMWPEILSFSHTHSEKQTLAYHSTDLFERGPNDADFSVMWVLHADQIGNFV